MNLSKKIYIILGLIVGIVFSFGITYSYFNSEAKIEASTDLAKFIFDAEIVDYINIPLLSLTPGSDSEFSFYVKNTNRTQRSDVTVNYKITLKTYHFIPLEIELYKSDELVLVCDETFDRNSENELVCMSDDFLFEYNDLNEHEFLLKLTFDEEYNTEEYKNLVDFIRIDIKSNQKTKEKN